MTMSGPGASGAKQRARVYQVDKATYQSGGIQRKGLVDVDKRLLREPKKVLIGLRVRNDQDILGFRMFGKNGAVQIPLSREAPNGTIATQLNTVAPASGERWIGYVSDYDPEQHGENGFRTEIHVSNFTANANGFQEIPVAFTYHNPAGNEFAVGHYIVTTSILPGQNADPEPPPEHPIEGAKAKQKPKAKPKVKGHKNLRAAKSKKARRKKR
jgi:hypothetical protein